MNLAEKIVSSDEAKKFISERLSNIYKYAFWFKFYAQAILWDHEFTKELIKGHMPFKPI